MNIYVIYRQGVVINVTTLPRIVQDEFKRGADTVDLWRNSKREKAFTAVKEFNRFINPRPTEDDEMGGSAYEW